MKTHLSSLKPGVVVQQNNGQFQLDITSNVDNHPALNPEVDNYPEAEGAATRARYQEISEKAFSAAVRAASEQ